MNPFEMYVLVIYMIYLNLNIIVTACMTVPLIHNFVSTPCHMDYRLFASGLNVGLWIIAAERREKMGLRIIA